jgi:transposase InsO family protein
MIENHRLEFSGMSVEETSLCLRMAIKTEASQGLLFHSDRGVQYASKKFTNVVDSYKIITRSMSRKGTVGDSS